MRSIKVYFLSTILLLTVFSLFSFNSIAASEWNYSNPPNYTLYKVGDTVNFNGKTYKCKILHLVYAKNWTPVNAAALWEATANEKITTKPNSVKIKDRNTADKVNKRLIKISKNSQYHKTKNAPQKNQNSPHPANTSNDNNQDRSTKNTPLKNQNSSHPANTSNDNNQDRSTKNTPLKNQNNPHPANTSNDNNQNHSSSTGKRIVGYFTNWSIYEAHNFYKVSKMPWSKLTHVNYAFVKPTSSGNLELIDAWADIEKVFSPDKWDTKYKGVLGKFKQYKQKYSKVKVLASAGGWTLSGEFFSIAASPSLRNTFATNTKTFLDKHGFDGIDIDWEYPGITGGPGTEGKAKPSDKENYVLLLKALRAKLGNKYLITIAAPAGSNKIKHISKDMASVIDFANLMTYDFHGSWEKTTNHHSALFKNPKDSSDEAYIKNDYNTDSAVKQYISLGFPKSKLNVGVPYYSRGWSGVSGGQNGLFGKATASGKGLWDGSEGGGQNPFYHIKNVMLKNPSFKEYRDNISKVPYIYNPSSKEFYTYEDEISAKLKATYVKKLGLGGIMFWELSGDTDQHSLTDAIYSGLN